MQIQKSESLDDNDKIVHTHSLSGWISLGSNTYPKSMAQILSCLILIKNNGQDLMFLMFGSSSVSLFCTSLRKY